MPVGDTSVVLDRVFQRLIKSLSGNVISYYISKVDKRKCQ